jgi:hypothetical protein
MWKIRSLTRKDGKGKPMYWANDVGWTWKDFSDTYTGDQREEQPLPRGGVWEEVQDGV